MIDNDEVVLFSIVFIIVISDACKGDFVSPNLEVQDIF
jgi:hypothetical protein